MRQGVHRRALVSIFGSTTELSSKLGYQAARWGLDRDRMRQ